MMEPTKTSSQPKAPATSSPSPSPSNAGDTDPSASTPTLGGILPELKAHVLDYLPYETVEVALPMLDPEAEKDRGKVHNANAGNRGGDADASKKKRNGGVAGAVTTLNITSGTQLDGSLTSKFPNVEEVNCLSFLRAADDSPADQRILVVCRETATRLVPVLSSFSKLRRIYVGGGSVETDEDGVERLVREEYWYNRRVRERLRNHPNLSLASSLAYQLIGALKARVIPPLERMDGVATLLHAEGGANNLCPGFGNSNRQSKDPQDMCEWCRDVCSHLPLEDIGGSRWWSACVDRVVLLEVIAARDGKRTKEFLCDPAWGWVEDMREVLVYYLWEDVYVPRIQDVARSQDLKKRVRLGRGKDGCDIFYMDRSSLAFIDRMIAVGWDPNSLVDKIWFYKDEMIPRGTFDALVSRGFPISESDCVVFDEMAEPALRNYTTSIRR